MKTHYNLFAGQSLERLAALSDGIFAVVMTLLVLDLRVPFKAIEDLHQQPLWIAGQLYREFALWGALVTLSPRLLTYFMSFLTLGIFWVGHQTQLNHFTHSDRNLSWIHLAYLFTVTMMPFSTGFLSEYTTFRLPLVIYWFNILLLGVILLLSWQYAERSGLVKDDVAEGTGVATRRRIIVAQSLYAFGALLCVINTYISIAFIVLVQLNYVFAPKIRPLDRL